jgi:hypothetical protein
MCNTSVRSGKTPVELILCGSGSASLAHIGVLKALSERGVAINHITATSMGAVIAALYANGLDASAILELFMDQHPEQFQTGAWLGLQPCKTMFCPTQDVLPEARKLVRVRGLRPLGSFTILCYDLHQHGTVVYQGTDYDLPMALTASCAVPGVSRPVRHQDVLLVDCSLYGCRLDRRPGLLQIFSQAHVAGDVPENSLTPVDRWLRQRSRLIARASSDLGPLPGNRVIDIAVTAVALSACSTSKETLLAIVAAGYQAAIDLPAVALRETIVLKD